MASLPSSKYAFTHLLAMLAGVAIGKSIDADELHAYRSAAGEGPSAKLRRRIKSLLAGGLVVGLIIETGRRAFGGGGDRIGASTGGAR